VKRPRLPAPRPRRGLILLIEKEPKLWGFGSCETAFALLNIEQVDDLHSRLKKQRTKI